MLFAFFYFNLENVAFHYIYVSLRGLHKALKTVHVDHFSQKDAGQPVKVRQKCCVAEF